MARSLTRTPFHRSALTRTLAGMGALGATDPGNAFAEQLGQWVDFKGAITLSAIHSTPAAPLPNGTPPAPPDSASKAVASVARDFARTRTAMEAGIAASFTPGAGPARLALPVPAPGLSADEACAYAPYRRCHQAIQHDLETKVATLRARVRECAAQASPPLQRLAALDAAFDAILCEREARLLATLPSRLEKRFHQLHQAHQQDLSARQSADSVEQWWQPGAWLARFRGELRSVLLAELDLRLQPTLGLLDALHNEIPQSL
jgi:hypothetical protein